MPFFSVVIPVYNRADLVCPTLDSVAGQTHDSWELLVVDDGSTDGTLAMLEEYRQRLGDRMQVLQQSNAGPGAARNRGIAAARGRYVAFLDSDDLWFPWTLEFYRRALEAHDFPAFLAGAPLVFEQRTQWEEARQTAAPATLESARIESFPDYLAAGEPARWYSVSSFVMRRDALADKAFCSRPINAEDIDFTLQMGVEPGFVDVQSPATFGYREHSASIMADYLRTVQGVEFLLDNERHNRYPGGAARQRERRVMLSRHIRPALLEFLRRGYRRRAWRAFAQMLPWHLQLRRARFLLGFALVSLRPRRGR